MFFERGLNRDAAPCHEALHRFIAASGHTLFAHGLHLCGLCWWPLLEDGALANVHQDDVAAAERKLEGLGYYPGDLVDDVLNELVEAMRALSARHVTRASEFAESEPGDEGLDGGSMADAATKGTGYRVGDLPRSPLYDIQLMVSDAPSSEVESESERRERRSEGTRDGLSRVGLRRRGAPDRADGVEVDAAASSALAASRRSRRRRPAPLADLISLIGRLFRRSSRDSRRNV